MPRRQSTSQLLAVALCVCGVSGSHVSRAAAGDKHCEQLYRAVQGYMLQPTTTNIAPPQYYPSPQSHPSSQYGEPPSKATPQLNFGGAPQPASPTFGTPTVTSVPLTFGTPTNVVPVSYMAASQPMTFGTPVMAAPAPVQYQYMPTLGVAAQPAPVPQFGAAPVYGQQVMTATPVTVLIPYKKHCVLFGGHH